MIMVQLISGHMILTTSLHFHQGFIMQLSIIEAKPILDGTNAYQLITFSDGTKVYCENGSIIRGPELLATKPAKLIQPCGLRNHMALCYCRSKVKSQWRKFANALSLLD